MCHTHASVGDAVTLTEVSSSLREDRATGTKDVQNVFAAIGDAITEPYIPPSPVMATPLAETTLDTTLSSVSCKSDMPMLIDDAILDMTVSLSSSLSMAHKVLNSTLAESNFSSTADEHEVVEISDREDATLHTMIQDRDSREIFSEIKCAPGTHLSTNSSLHGEDKLLRLLKMNHPSTKEWTFIQVIPQQVLNDIVLFEITVPAFSPKNPCVLAGALETNMTSQCCPPSGE